MSCLTAEGPDLDGRDLTPLLADPDAPWDRPVITIFDYGEYSIRDERFRYIREPEALATLASTQKNRRNASSR